MLLFFQKKKTLPYFLLTTLLLTAVAKAEQVVIPGPNGVALRAEYYVPPGGQRGAAIVALHGCGGPFPARDAQWRERLTFGGHAVLFPDSFGSRGLGSQCRERNRMATAAGLRRLDAIAAAQWLVARPDTPPGGVVLMGWSNGASTTLATARAGFDLPAGLFRGFVVFYAGCAEARSEAWQPAAPMLMLHGEADEWTAFAPCRALAERVRPPLLTLHSYPGAYHDFDAPGPVRVLHNIPGANGSTRSVHAGNDPAAQADALIRVPAWIAQLQRK